MPYPRQLPATGTCRCGRVRLRVTKPAMLTMACHCHGCQKMTGSAFSLSLALPADGVEVLEGELVRGGLQGEHTHLYCAFCKSWVMTRPAGIDWLVNLRASILDPHADFVPFIETCTDARLSWVSTPAKHSFAGFPAMEEYQPLVEAFAAEA
ncbi:GFA family protein [Rhodanobacter soli]|uniref:GFA family protein n=1 Tax=Rhodanobacter soli TaxID=590609 RepID=UPI0031DD22C5